MGLTLLLFIAVYAPVFAFVGIRRLSPNLAVPVLIVATGFIASILIGAIAIAFRIPLRTFGFRLPATRYLIYALALATPISALAALALSHIKEPGPLAGLQLGPSLVMLYFIVGAPVQEELIFRGLLQTTLARNLQSVARSAATPGIASSLAVATLFALVHLVVGPVTALGAFCLGLLAGELRRRSGSLLPAIVCHAIFNAGGVLPPGSG